MNDFMKLKEFKAGENAYQSVAEAIKEYQQIRQKTAEGVVKALASITDQLIEANAKLDAANADLASEQIHQGKSSQETAERVKAATIEVDRIMRTRDSIAQTSGLAVLDLRNRINSLKVKLNEAMNEEIGLRGAYNHPDKKAAAKQLNERIAAAARQQQELRNEINIMEQNIRSMGSVPAAMRSDAATVAAAQKVLEKAVEAWTKRQAIQEDLYAQIDKKKQDIEEMTEQLGMLEECLSSASPDYLVDLLYAGEVGAVLWPSLWADYRAGKSEKSQIDTKLRVEVAKRRKAV